MRELGSDQVHQTANDPEQAVSDGLIAGSETGEPLAISARPATWSATAPPVDADSPELRHLVSWGLRWSFVNQAALRLASFSLGIVLARILAPEDFGVFAVALSAVNFLVSFNDFGMIMTLTRWKEGLDDAAPTAVTIAAVGSAIVYGAAFLLAPSLAHLMGAPSATGVVRLAALSIIVDGLTAAPAALLARNFQQNRLAAAQLIAFPVAFATAVILGVGGSGAWSLAWAHVIGHVGASLLIFVLAPSRPKPGFDRHRARELLGFGVPAAATVLVSAILLNIDNVLVGRALGPTALGFYAIAFNVANWPVGLLTDTIARVALPGFSRLSYDRAALAEGYTRSFALLVRVALPLSLLLALLAEPLVHFLYGERWDAAVAALRFLAIFGAARVLADLMMVFLVGADRPTTALLLRLSWIVIVLPALAIGIERDGIRGAAIAHCVVAAVVAIPMCVVAAARLGVDVARLASTVARPALACVVAAMTIQAVLAAVTDDMIRLVLGAGTGVAVFAAIVVPRDALARRRRSVPVGRPRT